MLQACEWFEKIGISTTGTRLEAIRRYLDELLNPTTPEAKPLGEDATEEDTYYALSDGAGFGLIAAEMAKLSPQIIRHHTLQDILKGPLAASREEPSTNNARNKYVELEFAAHCSSAGFKLLGLDDLKFEFEGHQYLVECKRPFREATLDRNIEEAYSQLRGKLGHASDRGIVGVAVEKVFGLDRRRIHQVESASSATAFAVSIAKELRSRIAKYERMWIDSRVVGVLAIIRFLMKTGVPESLGASYIFGLVKFASPQVAQAAESERLDRMIEALRQKFLAT
jgi:hypothetical protein